MRTLRQVERELTEARLLAAAANLGPSLDNDGRVAYTADERRASYARQIRRLEADRAALRRVLGGYQEHGYQPDPDKAGWPCRFCGLDERNPAHRGDDTL